MTNITKHDLIKTIDNPLSFKISLTTDLSAINLLNLKILKACYDYYAFNHQVRVKLIWPNQGWVDDLKIKITIKNQTIKFKIINQNTNFDQDINFDPNFNFDLDSFITYLNQALNHPFDYPHLFSDSQLKIFEINQKFKIGKINQITADGDLEITLKDHQYLIPQVIKYQTESIIVDYTRLNQLLITRFRKNIWRMFLRSIDDYQLVKPHDKIAVCISGGKDSMLLAKCFQELKDHGQIDFELVNIVLDPGYQPQVLQQIIANANLLGVDIKIHSANLFNYVSSQESPCYICARMRRGHLYSIAKQHGCNKIALGHHLNDVIETTLMGMFYSSEISFMRPKLRSRNFENIELIRPLYQVKEKDIINWRDTFNLNFIACSCPLTQNLEPSKSKRSEIKNIIKTIKTTNPEIEEMIFRSIHNLNLNTIVGYRQNDQEFNFNQIYEEDPDGTI